ncbi:MAG TPA: UPF0280 family protein [Pseudothermotoga sp.]
MNRFYRNLHNGRFQSFNISYMETDLWIGVDRFKKEMIDATQQLVVELHEQLRDYMKENRDFLLSFQPVKVSPQCPEIAKKMAEAAEYACVGPMAAVAGAFADEVGRLLIEKFNCSEVLVENGGDIFIKNTQPVTVCIYAGDSPLSQKIGFRLPAGSWGVCTSSGTVGHSISFGKADAVTVICENATIADAFATAYCNMIKTKEDIEKLLEVALNEHVQTTLVIYQDKLGVIGKHELMFITSEVGGKGESD